MFNIYAWTASLNNLRTNKPVNSVVEVPWVVVVIQFVKYSMLWNWKVQLPCSIGLPVNPLLSHLIIVHKFTVYLMLSFLLCLSFFQIVPFFDFCNQSFVWLSCFTSVFCRSFVFNQSNNIRWIVQTFNLYIMQFRIPFLLPLLGLCEECRKKNIEISFLLTYWHFMLIFWWNYSSVTCV